MRRTTHSLILGVIALASLAPRPASGGAYTYASALAPDIVMHPHGYTGAGGPLSVSVCIDPSSPNAAAMVPTVQNIVATYNAALPTVGNIALGSNNNIPSGHVDFESVAIHEVGHCLGMAHPNAATESGLPSADRDYTRADVGPNGRYDLDDGADNIQGSRDDRRGDDVNLHWFHRADNDPFSMPSVVDASTYSRNLANLPPGHSFAANGSRDVAARLGYPPTEAVMQQLTYFDEAQRTLTHDDVATLRFAMAGLDRTAGTADDYSLQLTYAGLTSSCDIPLRFSTEASLAFCRIRFTAVTSTDYRILSAEAVFNPGFNWFFNPLATPPASPTTTPTMTPTPSQTPTPSPTWTRTSTPTHTATATPSSTPTHTSTSTPTITPTPTLSATPTATFSPVPSATATASPTTTATSTPTPSPTASPTPSPSMTATATATPVPLVLAGAIRHFASNAGVPDVALVGLPVVSATGPTGTFSVATVRGESLALTPDRAFLEAGTVDALDAARILQIATTPQEPSTARRLACDTSGNGTISAFDAALVLRYVVGLDTALPVVAACGTPWAFVPSLADGAAGTPLEPQIEAAFCEPGAIVHAPATSSDGQQNFQAVPFGDCDGDWSPGHADAETLADASTPVVVAGPLHGRPRLLRFPIEVVAGFSWNGIEGTLAYDPVALRFEELRRVGDTRSALFATNDAIAGEVRFAFASSSRIDAGNGPTFVAEFSPVTRGAAAATVSLIELSLDGVAARIEIR